jgi:hypothetical protein
VALCKERHRCVCAHTAADTDSQPFAFLRVPSGLRWSSNCLFVSGVRRAQVITRILTSDLLPEVLSALIVIMTIGVVLLVEIGF